jgi:hypothetical protein
MKLWLLSQDENNNYDTYDSIIVAAKTEADAIKIHPYGKDGWSSFAEWNVWSSKPENVTATLIGTAVKGTKEGVILGSFKAG